MAVKGCRCLQAKGILGLILTLGNPPAATEIQEVKVCVQFLNLPRGLRNKNTLLK